MASHRILQIRNLLENEQELLKHVPIQDIQHEPDPAQTVCRRFAQAVCANLDQSMPAHLPGSWLAGNGGYLFRKRAKPEWLLPEDYTQLRDFPKSYPDEMIDCLELGLFSASPFMWGHVCVNVLMVLELGIEGIIRRLQERLQDETLTTYQHEFLECAILEWQAALRYEMRHRDFYLELARKEEDLQQKACYLEIAQRIGRVPAQPAEHFTDALQAICFFYLCLHAEDVGGHTIGRIDQMLIPYYRRDIESGVLTKEMAEEYFFDFWLKFNLSHIILETHSESWALKNTESDLSYRNGLVWTNFSDSITREKHTDDGFVIDIGGEDEDGHDGVNEISWLVLKALDELNTLGMKPVLKLNPKNDPAFVDACFEVLARRKNGFPAITFDENTVRAMQMQTEFSFTQADLRNACHIGCVELAIPGKSYTDPMNAFFNLPKILLLTMRGGTLDGKRITPAYAPADTFEEFFAQYCRQLEICIRIFTDAENAAAQVFNQKYKRPMVSSVISGCIENAQLADEGGAHFWAKSMNCCGLATTVDSLAAIRELVYQRKTHTMDSLLDILDHNFEGAESLRQYLLNKVPRYGNGDPSVDKLAEKLVKFYCKAVSACETWNGHRYHPGLYSYYGPTVNYGLHTGATPNGRLHGEPISLNTNPDHGAVRSGMTGALASVTAFDQALAHNATAIDVHMPGNTPPDVLRAMARYLEQNGALYMQVTIADREEMLDAQLHPQLHKDLVVRVTGFSAHFIALDRETQDEIISRSYWT